MLVSIKTLEGKLFKVEAAPEAAISEVKKAVEAAHPELPAASMKLIFSGKVLKDAETLVEKGISESSFLVCMVTKAKKPAASRSPAAPDAATPAAPQPAAASTETPAAQPAAQPAAPQPTPPQQPTPAQEQPEQTNDAFATAEAMAQLEAMGFGHAEQSRAALRAAMGNVDMAVEFLMNGIPDDHPGQQQPPTQQEGLARLREHPQFDELRRTVQENPTQLQNVLQHLGQQDAELLRLIHANQAEFLSMMNEPVAPRPGTAAAAQQQPAAGASGAAGQGAQAAAAQGGGGDGGFDEQAFARAFAAVTPAQRSQLAATIGLTPEQLETFAQQMQNMPRDQLRQLLGAFAAGAGGPDAAQNRPRVVRLTREEADAVNRLTELGFSRDDAAQAYLACDKDEALAANLLFDGFEPNPGFAGIASSSSDGADGAGASGGGGGGDDDDDDEDMYT
mmetsp:Transcript_17253/g.52478  ORF Transcript_17253/g.52478 Transcript_17253/m.52478 type:complete len:449 (+) Transcript_17253:103-1449(+)